jgi:hypothetical protein
MKSEFNGNIITVRAVEDAIRATKKYTKGAFNRFQSRPPLQAIQGGNFPSRVVTEYYEVYPDLEVSWDMSASRALSWVWGDVTHIDVRFIYDYREDLARVVIYGGTSSLEELYRGILGFKDALDLVIKTEAQEQQDVKTERGSREQDSREPQRGPQPVPVVDRNNRIGNCSVSHP